MNDTISLCNKCNCMTHTIADCCGKCGEAKGQQTRNEVLRNQITAIIYGEEWEASDIADAHKPDVEAIMKLVEKEIVEAHKKGYIDKGIEEITNDQL